MHDFNWRDNNIQIMPGLEGDLEEWQTQEVNVTRSEAEGDIDLLTFSIQTTAAINFMTNLVFLPAPLY